MSCVPTARHDSETTCWTLIRRRRRVRTRAAGASPAVTSRSSAPCWRPAGAARRGPARSTTPCRMSSSSASAQAACSTASRSIASRPSARSWSASSATSPGTPRAAAAPSRSPTCSRRTPAPTSRPGSRPGSIRRHATSRRRGPGRSWARPGTSSRRGVGRPTRTPAGGSPSWSSGSRRASRSARSLADGGADPDRLHREYARARREFRAALLEVMAAHHPGTPADVERTCAQLILSLRS